MAYQFADGFDNYGNGTTFTNGYPWDTVTGANTSSTADFRFAPPGSLPGGCCIVVQAGAMTKNLSSSQATLIAGCGYKTSSLPASGSAPILAFQDSGTIQCTLAMSSTGQLQAYKGSSAGTLLGSSAASTITANSWIGVQVQTTISTTVGTFQVFVNGSSTPALTLTGLNNQSSANASANQVVLQAGNLAFTFKYDDFFCLDTTGVALNALPGGDVRILTKLPSGAGNYTNWTPNGLASNFQNVAVTPPSTSDFNANNTATTKDSYAMQSAGLTVAPFFVLARASMTRDDAGPHTPSIFVRSSSTDSTGVVTPALSASYVFYDAVFATDPNTGSAWTGPNADAAQAGVIEG